MTGVRNILSAFLAFAAILSFSAWDNSASAACPVETAMAMSGHHQHHPMGGRQAPAAADQRMDCAACIAVLPPLPAAEPQALRPVAHLLQICQPLSGIDPALDPPPPRMA